MDRVDSQSDITIRGIPYPYRAMLVVCSDLDETPDRDVYLESMRFLNTTNTTSVGPGVGLEVGNTLYFDMPPDQFSYWNTDDAGRDILRTLIRSGHIDCLHSYGDVATTRAHVGRALDELVYHDCRLQVWIDHAVAPTNFGSDIMCGSGDVVGAAAYHADLTCGYGVEFVWRGRLTSVIGQDTEFGLGGVWNTSHPLGSLRTVTKAMCKQALSHMGVAKYRMHGDNRVYCYSTLRDGTVVCEFIRSNPHWCGVSSCDTGRDIGEVLTHEMLDRLINREGVCILYTHLGKVAHSHIPFDRPGVEAFRRLTERVQAGDILVATTRRTLGYLRMRDEISYSTRQEGSQLRIEVECCLGGGDSCTGLTFYVPEDTDCRLVVNGILVENLSRNPADHSGRCSISIPWRRLEFPGL